MALVEVGHGYVLETEGVKSVVVQKDGSIAVSYTDGKVIEVKEVSMTIVLNKLGRMPRRMPWHR